MHSRFQIVEIIIKTKKKLIPENYKFMLILIKFQKYFVDYPVDATNISSTKLLSRNKQLAVTQRVNLFQLP